eukprot:32800_1
MSAGNTSSVEGDAIILLDEPPKKKYKKSIPTHTNKSDNIDIANKSISKSNNTSSTNSITDYNIKNILNKFHLSTYFGKNDINIMQLMDPFNKSTICINITFFNKTNITIHGIFEREIIKKMSVEEISKSLLPIIIQKNIFNIWTSFHLFDLENNIYLHSDTKI